MSSGTETITMTPGEARLRIVTADAPIAPAE
jgi:hypothetical protein